MSPLEQITQLIPHRPPFLWVDRIISCDAGSITTEKFIDPDLEVFQGHYPENPIMPGVLLCEIIFQSGALLISKTAQSGTSETKEIPVLTRIENAKFKRPVLPGDTVQIQVTLKETISSVSFLKGTLKVSGKTAVQVVFACAFVAVPELV
jgi:3-hydroxyacyl-[acyl-carrier-protein] dehydratase